MTSKIAVIGFGNIAKAIINTLFDKKLLNPKEVYCLVNTKKSLENIRKNYKYDINIFQAEDGIRDSVASRGLGDVYKRQILRCLFV